MLGAKRTCFSLKCSVVPVSGDVKWGCASEMQGLRLGRLRLGRSWWSVGVVLDPDTIVGSVWYGVCWAERGVGRSKRRVLLKDPDLELIRSFTHSVAVGSEVVQR